MSYTAKWEILSPKVDGMIEAVCNHCGYTQRYYMETSLGKDEYWHLYPNCPRCRAIMSNTKLFNPFIGY